MLVRALKSDFCSNIFQTYWGYNTFEAYQRIPSNCPPEFEDYGIPCSCPFNVTIDGALLFEKTSSTLNEPLNRHSITIIIFIEK
jgi:hypothetical protein